MQHFHFDFQGYIEGRKNLRKMQLREGAGYAFAADLRMVRRMRQVKPVDLVLEEARRLFHRDLHAQLLEQAQRVTPQSHPTIHHALVAAATALHIEVPPCYVSGGLRSTVPVCLGVGEDAYLVIPESFLQDAKQDAVWLPVLGTLCGHVQNGHTPLLTALYYATEASTGARKWALAPAKVLLQTWRLRAAITADRAGLICAQNEDTARSAVMLLCKERDPREVQLRLRALAHFATTQYYLSLRGQTGGVSKEACDEAVAEWFGKDSSNDQEGNPS